MMFLILLIQSALAGSVCVDGWVSSSSGSGTCSHHGGISGSSFRNECIDRRVYNPALKALQSCTVDQQLNVVGKRLDCPGYFVEVTHILKQHKWILWSRLDGVQDVRTDTMIYNSSCTPASNSSDENEIVCGYIDMVYNRDCGFFTIGDISDLVQPHVKLRVTLKNEDNDDIPDVDDKCPSEPEDKDNFKDEDGCPDVDNDNDKIVDSSDSCPKEPEDFDSFEDNDGCPDSDNDGDNIRDVVDECPDDVEDKDRFQDTDGCPELDNDKDGVADMSDRCPDQAENVNGASDDDGCPDDITEVVKLTSGKYPADKKTISDLKQSGCFVRMAEELGFVKASCPK